MALARVDREAFHEAVKRRDSGGVVSPAWRTRTLSNERVGVWLMALNLADEIDISPWDALLVAVKRRAARVRSCDVIAEKIMEKHRQECADDPDYAATHDPEVPPATVRTWLAESRNEERIMVRTAKMAVDAGVADAMIRRMEREGQLLTESLVAALDSIELDPDQRMAAFAALHKYIAQTPILQSDNHKIIEGRPQEDQ